MAQFNLTQFLYELRSFLNKLNSQIKERRFDKPEEVNITNDYINVIVKKRMSRNTVRAYIYYWNAFETTINLTIDLENPAFLDDEMLEITTRNVKELLKRYGYTVEAEGFVINARKNIEW